MKIDVQLPENSYSIYIESKSLQHIQDYIPCQKKTAICYDDGLPAQWIECLKKQIPHALCICIPQGESSKSLSVYESILQKLIEHQFTRKDQIIALGGGVVGDLSGFVAATYMRGIDFYNIPTTILSQVDSSVGGKVAINMGSYKNMVGAFYQPKCVIIDPDVLSTLSLRQRNNGLIEALKMGLILDSELFSWFEQEQLPFTDIIARSVQLKKQIVEQDEKESGIRAILNFGHTIGHAIEAKYPYYHGECVSKGMLYFIEDESLKQRVKAIYKKLNMPDMPELAIPDILDGIVHDKKGSQQGIACVFVPQLGKHAIHTLSIFEIEQRLKGDFHEK